MAKNTGRVVEYKTFNNRLDDIDMVLSSMGLEHVEISDNKYVTFLIEVENPTQGFAVKRHLDRVIN